MTTLLKRLERTLPFASLKRRQELTSDCTKKESDFLVHSTQILLTSIIICQSFASKCLTCLKDFRTETNRTLMKMRIAEYLLTVYLTVIGIYQVTRWVSLHCKRWQ